MMKKKIREKRMLRKSEKVERGKRREREGERGEYTAPPLHNPLRSHTNSANEPQLEAELAHKPRLSPHQWSKGKGRKGKEGVRRGRKGTLETVVHG